MSKAIRAVDPIGRALRSRAPGEYVVVSKRVVAFLPQTYRETALGTPPGLAHSGAIRQYRGPYRRHVYETASTWIAHKDLADPRRDPVGHVLLDVPELAGAAIAGGVAGVVVAHRTRSRRLAEGATEAEANSDAALNGFLAALLAGGAAYIVISAIKKSRGRAR